ncbi:PTS maltose transporter subunit IIBC [Paenibacillus sp. BIHB 4019]|uniref:Phosphocarrier protein HPr n=1 Tax=Paenibacillus sp. BIHB 4019 TaxID=1870819 RepID=A0A1B2DR40_9BACL|nr:MULTISPECIES: HPr family phosphocarrier protein [unclassified Paenibacillus]ANY70182.1 PTS maltose transporter subunit IIBC [Paenibacillus sp. BIHB 4019]KQO12700.1 PTS maltose transporter subunit IIBC [Paenibacillus sp. Leaf72]
MQKTFKITDEDGIHARPATALVNTASKFETEVYAEANGKKVTLKSILGLLSFDLEAGELITFSADGADAAEAISALEDVMTQAGLGVVHA